MMPISDPRDGFFYPHHIPMKDSYYIKKGLSTLYLIYSYLKVPYYVKEYGLNTFPIFLYISTPVISNNWYLKVKFLGPENLL